MTASFDRCRSLRYGTIFGTPHMSFEATIGFSTFITEQDWLQFLQTDPTALRLVGDSDPALLSLNGFSDLRGLTESRLAAGLPPSGQIYTRSVASFLYRRSQPSGEYGRDHFAVLEIAKAAQRCFGGDLQVALAPDECWFTLVGAEYRIDRRALIDLWKRPDSRTDPRPDYIRRLTAMWSADGSADARDSTRGHER